MANELSGVRVAILVDSGFEQAEMTEPRRALDEAGAETVLVSPHSQPVRSWHLKDWGKDYPVDRPLADARADDFDALLVPGGVMSPDRLRMRADAVAFVRAFAQTDKPIASICHGPWLLVEADVVKGRTLTSWPSLQTDIRNAGGQWVDREVVSDGNIVTSRKPDDIPAFNRAMIELFAAAARQRRAA